MKTDNGRTAKALLGLMFLCAVVEGPHSAVQAQQAVTKPLEHEVGVVLKLVHVYVTDKKGRPVPDLARDDFSLLDNGTPVTITEFEKHTLSATASEPVPEPALAAPVVRPASRKFILFFDLAFNDAWGIAKAKEAAAHFLDSEVRPEDEVGAISYSLFGGVKVHEFMTKDHGKVRDILDEIDQGGITGRAEEIEAWYWRTISASMPNPDNPARGGQDPLKLREAMADRQQLKEQTQTYVLSLTTLAKALRLLPGQKHFILFSRGVPTSVIYGNQAGFRDFQMEMHPTLAKTQFDMGDPKLKASNEGMFKEFAAAGCAFYALDTHASAKGADLFGYDTRGGNPTSLGALYGDSTNIFNDPKATGGNYLKRFSDITGGRYFSNIRAFEKNLDQIQALTGTYYVLGYSINERWDGRFHDIKITVDRKGCEVRAQAGYFNPKPFSEYTKLEKQLHLYDLALNERAFSRLPVNIGMIPLVYGGGTGSRLGIIARAPGELTDRLSGKQVEFVVVFFNDKGEVSDVVRAETDPASHRGRDLIFTASAELEPGAYSCRLVARDMDTGLSAVGSAIATIGAPRASGLQLSTPLLLTESATAAHIDAGPAGKKGGPPVAEAYPYDRSRLSPVAAELPPGTVSVQALVPYLAQGDAEPDLAFLAYVIDAKSAARTSVTFARIERIRSGPRGLLSFEIPVAGLAAGTYYLHFHAEDRASRSIGHAYATVVIPPR